MSRPRILIVEDDVEWQDIYGRCLDDTQYEIIPVRKLAAALALLEQEPFDVVITDLQMLGPGEFSGFAVLEQAKVINPDLQVIVITGYGSTDHAQRAMGGGAYDYLTKSRNLRDRLAFSVQGALRARSLERELLDGVPEDDTEREYDRVIGNSAGMQGLFKQMVSAADSDVNVLIRGEESTGKRLIAQTIHGRSRRKDGPFLSVDCGRLSDSVLRGELFGYEAGTLYGIEEARPGMFERARGGTVFLDAVGDLGPEFQDLLIDAIRDRAVRRAGGQESIPVDARIIASTDKDLATMLSDGRFHRQFFDMLNVLVISVPPLRERKDGDDIPALAAMFLQRYSKGRQVRFSHEATDLLLRYDYPGNVRELESAIKYALTVTPGEVIGPEHLRPEIRTYELPRRGQPQRAEPPSELEPKRRTRLLRTMSERLDEGDLRTFCFHLEIDYEGLPGRGKANKARELIQYLERRERIPELLEKGEQLRPDIPWHEI